MIANKLVNNNIKTMAIMSVFLAAITLFYLQLKPITVSAADTDFSNGIAVDSTGNGADSNVGNGICNDGSGNCTLRAAIQEANNNADLTTINFAIPGSGVRTIQPTSPLPDITAPVIIDGYSQAGSSPNTNPHPQPFNGTLLIELNGASAGSGSGLSIDNGTGGSRISGLIINRFPVNGVLIQGADPLDDVTISGNYIGTNSAGSVALPNAGYAGVQIDTGDKTDIVIGGNMPGDRNLISGNVSGVSVSGQVTGNEVDVIGNYIGLAANGTTDLGNSGFGVNAGANILNVRNNVISGNTLGGISHSGSDSRISSNFIGTTYQGEVNNSITQGYGITISLTANALMIGGETEQDSNVIAGNLGGGVTISEVILPFPLTLTPNNISIIGNSIFGNKPAGSGNLAVPGLGIEIISSTLDGSFQPLSFEDGGPNANDLGDTDTGPNNYMNFPVLGSAKQVGASLSIPIDVDAADTTDPGGEYRVEFFANDEVGAEGHGEGQSYLGFVNLENGEDQTAEITLPNGTDLSGKYISATLTAFNNATNSGFGSTSEFSESVTVDVAGVQSTDDQSAGALADTGQVINTLVPIVVLVIVAGVVVAKKHRIIS